MTQPKSATNEPSGPTEFGWGRGVQPPPELGAVPTPHEKHRAVLRAGHGDRSLDSGYTANYDEYVREPDGG